MYRILSMNYWWKASISQYYYCHLVLFRGWIIANVYIYLLFRKRDKRGCRNYSHIKNRRRGKGCRRNVTLHFDIFQFDRFGSLTKRSGSDFFLRSEGQTWPSGWPINNECQSTGQGQILNTVTNIWTGSKSDWWKFTKLPPAWADPTLVGKWAPDVAMLPVKCCQCSVATIAMLPVQCRQYTVASAVLLEQCC